MPTAFASMLAACGVSLADAVPLLGQSRSYIDKKAYGMRPASAADVNTLGKLWHAIRTGDEATIRGFPGLADPSGPLAMTEAIRLMRGVRGLEKASVPRSQKEADAALVEAYDLERKKS